MQWLSGCIVTATKLSIMPMIRWLGYLDNRPNHLITPSVYQSTQMSSSTPNWEEPPLLTMLMTLPCSMTWVMLCPTWVSQKPNRCSFTVFWQLYSIWGTLDSLRRGMIVAPWMWVFYHNRISLTNVNRFNIILGMTHHI